MSTIYERKAVCPYDCPDTCGMVVTTDGQKIYSVKGDPDHPITRGFLCRKMQHYEEDIHSPYRLLTPLLRTGEKGDPTAFTPISWEQAISMIGKHWREIIDHYGSDAILPYSYAGNMGMIQRNCGEAFFASLKTAHLDRTICSNAAGEGASRTMGEDFCDWNSPQIGSSDLIILWSDNPKSTKIHVVPQIEQAKKCGAKVIMVDVYQNISADLADDILLVRPGTDAPLLLAIMHELLKHQMLDVDFIKKYTTGYDLLERQFLQMTPERAEDLCGVPADKICAFAMDYGHAKRPMLVCGSGMSRYTNGGASFQLLLCLPALVGAWKKGGGMSSFMGSSVFFSKNPIKCPKWRDASLRSYNMNQLGTSLLLEGHPIKSLYVYVSNPAVMTPDQNNVIKGLSREDLFVIVHDRFLTDTALYADIVLPATFSVEQDDLYTSYGHYHAQAGWKVIDPPGQCKSNWDTFSLLADEMNLTKEASVRRYWNRTAKEFAFSLLEGEESAQYYKYPISTEARQALKEGEPILVPQADVMNIPTEDGKIHLAPPSPPYRPLSNDVPECLQNLTQASQSLTETANTRQQEAGSTAVSADRSHPLNLVMGHSPWSLNSNFSYREKLMKDRGSLTLKMSPEDAKLREISSNDICTAYNRFGTITVRVIVTDQVPKGTVIAEGVYQKAYTFGDGNFSSLLSGTLTDMADAAALNTHTVEVRKLSS